MQEKLDAGSADPSKRPVWPRAFGKLWPFLKYSFIASITLDFLGVLSSAHVFLFFKAVSEGGEISLEEANIVDLHQSILGGLSIIVFIASVIAYCRFYYRATNNLVAIDAAGLRTTPFWAVGVFFIPIVSLWKPLQAVRQIWRASFDPERGDVAVPAMIGWWWFCWILNGVLGNASVRLYAKSGAFSEAITDYDLFLGSTMLDILAAPLVISAAIIVLRFSSRIKSAQEQNVLSHSPGNATFQPNL